MLFEVCNYLCSGGCQYATQPLLTVAVLSSADLLHSVVAAFFSKFLHVATMFVPLQGNSLKQKMFSKHLDCLRKKLPANRRCWRRWVNMSEMDTLFNRINFSVQNIVLRKYFGTCPSNAKRIAANRFGKKIVFVYLPLVWNHPAPKTREKYRGRERERMHRVNFW